MEKTKHTPTPYEWRAWGQTISIDSLAPNPDITEQRIGVAHINPNGYYGRGIPSAQDKANAEFIVRACNHFDEMVELLSTLSITTFDPDARGAIKTLLKKVRES